MRRELKMSLRNHAVVAKKSAGTNIRRLSGLTWFDQSSQSRFRREKISIPTKMLLNLSIAGQCGLVSRKLQAQADGRMHQC
jgi:hypothetical protein